MESADFTRHYIIRYLITRELVLPHPEQCGTMTSAMPFSLFIQKQAQNSYDYHHCKMCV